MRLIHVVIRCCLALDVTCIRSVKLLKLPSEALAPVHLEKPIFMKIIRCLSVNPKQSLILPGVVRGGVRGVAPGVVPWVVSVVVPEGKMKCYILK